jgi:hypothetical protein
MGGTNAQFAVGKSLAGHRPSAPCPLEPPAPSASIRPKIPINPISSNRRKYYFDGGQVEIATEHAHALDADGTPHLIFKDEAGRTTISDTAVYEDLRGQFEP